MRTSEGNVQVHKPNSPAFDTGTVLVAALMAVGNGANGRKRSGYSRPLTADTPIRGTLIMSAEAGLADTIRAAGQVMLTGQFARGIELHLGQYGMFDVLCGHDSSAELAEYVKDQSKEYAGFVGDAFVETVATNWESVNKMWLSRRDEVRDGILQAADIGKPKGTEESPVKQSAGKDFCTEQGDTYMQGMLRLCKAGATRDLYVVQEDYCRMVATTFVEVGMLKPGGGSDPINLPLIAPCLRAQGWSISAVEPKGPKPNQRVGATGSL